MVDLSLEKSSCKLDLGHQILKSFIKEYKILSKKNLTNKQKCIFQQIFALYKKEYQNTNFSNKYYHSPKYSFKFEKVYLGEKKLGLFARIYRYFRSLL